MTLYYLRNQIDFHRPPENMVDKNIRTDYSKLKMLARIDHDNTHEGSRMSTIEEIAAKGEILVDLHTSFRKDSRYRELPKPALLLWFTYHVRHPWRPSENVHT